MTARRINWPWICYWALMVIRMGVHVAMFRIRGTVMAEGWCRGSERGRARRSGLARHGTALGHAQSRGRHSASLAVSACSLRTALGPKRLCEPAIMQRAKYSSDWR